MIRKNKELNQYIKSAPFLFIRISHNLHCSDCAFSLSFISLSKQNKQISRVRLGLNLRDLEIAGIVMLFLVLFEQYDRDFLENSQAKMIELCLNQLINNTKKKLSAVGSGSFLTIAVS